MYKAIQLYVQGCLDILNKKFMEMKLAFYNFVQDIHVSPAKLLQCIVWLKARHLLHAYKCTGKLYLQRDFLQQRFRSCH